MKKFSLMMHDANKIIRILEIRLNRVLIIDCIKKTMPVWVDAVELDSFSECSMEELIEETGVMMQAVSDMDAEQKKMMYDRSNLAVKQG